MHLRIQPIAIVSRTAFRPATRSSFLRSFLRSLVPSKHVPPLRLGTSTRRTVTFTFTMFSASCREQQRQRQQQGKNKHCHHTSIWHTLQVVAKANHSLTHSFARWHDGRFRGAEGAGTNAKYPRQKKETAHTHTPLD